MTDNTSADELLESILGCLGVVDRKAGHRPGQIATVQLLITSYTKQRELKARLDEIEHIVSGSEFSDDDFYWYEITQEEYCGTKYYSDIKHLNRDERIAQLEDQL